MSGVLDKIKAICLEYNMISPGDTIVCGLSGGADSVCLLTALLKLSAEMDFSVEAVHVNHCLRGDESDGDEDFCRRLCGELGVPFRAERRDVKSFAEENSLSVEEAARKVRYAVFSSVSGGKKIATAHNADDNLETMLLNLVRGSGIKGIAGIPPVRGNIIRPLLAVSRREIESYLLECDQDFVTDSTNLSDDYTRNKLRHNVIPVLKQINGSLTETAVGTARVLRSENDFIESETQNVYKSCLGDASLRCISAYPQVIRRRCISRLVCENIPSNGSLISEKKLAEWEKIAVSGGKINISGDFFLISDGKTVLLKKIPAKKDPEKICRPLQIGENRLFDGHVLLCRLVECDNMEKISFVHKNSTINWLDYDKIIGRAVVRNRKNGDRIQLKGRNFTSSVKKLINEQIPASLRPFIHFIEDEEGTVYGDEIGIAQRVCPDENTRRLLEITVLREERRS